MHVFRGGSLFWCVCELKCRTSVNNIAPSPKSKSNINKLFARDKDGAIRSVRASVSKQASFDRPRSSSTTWRSTPTPCASAPTACAPCTAATWTRSCPGTGTRRGRGHLLGRRARRRQLRGRPGQPDGVRAVHAFDHTVDGLPAPAAGVRFNRVGLHGRVLQPGFRLKQPVAFLFKVLFVV